MAFDGLDPGRDTVATMARHLDGLSAEVADIAGLAAGRNTRPHPHRRYRRDMGGGNLAPMKDAAATITVRGRHWGGLRLAYRIG